VSAGSPLRRATWIEVDSLEFDAPDPAAVTAFAIDQPRPGDRVRGDHRQNPSEGCVGHENEDEHWPQPRLKNAEPVGEKINQHQRHARQAQIHVDHERLPDKH